MYLGALRKAGVDADETAIISHLEDGSGLPGSI
jgi:hypothetical protein